MNRTHGVVATTLGVLAMGACADPEQNTDLRPEGPPEVLAVLVMTDAAGHLAESATYCKPNDPKRPSLVGLPDHTTSQVCPDDGSPTDPVANAWPDGWYVRIMFDELLDPTVEELTELLDDDGVGTGTFSGSIANTQPVTLECQNGAGAYVNVDYDGYYSPAGNNVTWPLGPSLVIKPSEPRAVATGRECRVTITDVVTDKEGTVVDTAQRGPYTFKLAPITAIFTDPSDSGDTAEPTAVDALGPYFDNFYIQWNTDVQLSSLCTLDTLAGFFCQPGTEQFQLTPAASSAEAGGDWNYCSGLTAFCDTTADCPTGQTCLESYVYTYGGTAADDEMGVGYNTPLKTDTMYTFSLKNGAKLKDRCGVETTFATASADDLTSITFKTNKFAFSSINIATGETAGPTKKLNIKFNNVVDGSSLEASEYTITPAPASFQVAAANYSGGEIVLGGQYALDTMYTFTLKAGATVTDVYGATWTNDAEKTITWKTAPKVLLTTATANNTVFQKVLTVQSVGPTLIWNANIDLSTLGADEWSIVDAKTMAPVAGITPGVGGTGQTCTATSQGCQTRFRTNFAPGTYVFTLKKGATVSDVLGNVYTQEADRVINFTVKAPVPAVQCL